MLDFFDPKLKRGYHWRLAIGLVLVGVVLVLATFILALVTAGYNINHHNGKIYQNGLLFINSSPVSANIYINGSSSGRTNSRLELPEGNYSVTLKQSGYHDWNNSLSLFGGSVAQFDYPFLFPVKPKVSKEATFTSKPEIATQTPNQHYLLVSVPNQFATFQVFDDTNTKTPVTTVTLPSSIFTNQNGSLSVVEWSNDNQNVLLQHDYPGGSEYVVANWVTPANSFNVNQIFSSTTFSSVRLVNKQVSKLYLLDASTNSLYVGDVSSQSATLLLSNVLSYWPNGNNQILFVSPDSSKQGYVEAKVLNGTNTYNLQVIPSGSTYILNVASYNGDSYFVVGSSAINTVYVYMNPLSGLNPNNNKLPLPDTFLIVSSSPEDALFSNTAQILEVQAGDEFAVYDFRSQTHYRYTSDLQIPYGELAKWMDGDRLDLSIGGRLEIFDFDNTNPVNLTDSDSSYLPAFNSAYSAVYSLTPSAQISGGWQLDRTSLIVTP